MSYITKLRSKSVATRKRALIISVVLAMAVVVFVWATDLTGRFLSPEVSSQANEDIKPFKIFADSIKGTIDKITASAGNAQSVKDEPKVEKQIDLIPVEPKQ